MASDERNEDDCVINLDKEWMFLFTKEVEGTSTKELSRDLCSIFRIPTRVREIQPIAYEPHAVSIGPYHHHNPNLKKINRTKMLFMKELLKLNHSMQLVDYVKTVKKLESRIRAAYSESIEMESDHFCRMILLDGAFIIMFYVMLTKTGFYLEDPVINSTWARSAMSDDLLLVENQVPFFVLETLFVMATLESKYQISLAQVVLKANIGSVSVNFGVSWDTQLVEEGTYRHILHLLYSCIVASQNGTSHSEFPAKRQSLVYQVIQKTKKQFRHQETSVNRFDNGKTIPCAAGLQETGIRLKVKTESASYLDITFRDGVLEIPILRMYDGFDRMLRNFIALEQFFPRLGNKFLAHADFMDQLIDTAKDVALLQEHGILMNFVGNNESAASVFNRLNKYALMDWEKNYLFGLEEEVRRHCGSRWNRHRAKLKHDYFSNPWAALSLAGALVVIFLTLVQTFFAMFSNFRPPPSNN